MISKTTPAARLVGMQLKNGWSVEELLSYGQTFEDGEGTGGTFSVSYRVVRGAEVAFLKAFDLDRVIVLYGEDKMMETLQRETTAFLNEQGLNVLCVKNRMRQVVKIVDYGEVLVPQQPGDRINVVHYMIMELASHGDIRGHLQGAEPQDFASKFCYLKDVALGIKQLHSAKVSHQDIKPSNVMVFEKNAAKIGDLGRASIQGKDGVYDSWVVAGDQSYAPPEQLYGITLTEWFDRRERCDVYQFGSLICFTIFGLTVNEILSRKVPKEQAPSAWGGSGSSYELALPFLQKAFSEGMLEIRSAIPDWARDKVMSLIDQSANPDYKMRGSRRVLGKQSVASLGLDRFISELDRLRVEAEKHAIIRRKAI